MTTLKCSKYQLEIKNKTLIMGILNITPDSFSDGGKFINPNIAISHAKKMIDQGADIIDIGGESTRPFSQPVSVKDELQRVIPVIKALAPVISVPISIDTQKAEVARQAIEAGASIVNDISALNSDPNMTSIIADTDIPIIIMHMQGNPKNMQLQPCYNNVVQEVKQFLQDSIYKAEKNGIKRSQIIIDPGIGFGKTVEHNLLLLKHLDQFTDVNLPILVGTSRKAFIRTILSKNKEPITPDLPDVDIGTQASIAAAILNGANIVRVHNVFSAAATVKIIDAIKNVENKD